MPSLLVLVDQYLQESKTQHQCGYDHPYPSNESFPVSNLGISVGSNQFYVHNLHARCLTGSDEVCEYVKYTRPTNVGIYIYCRHVDNCDGFGDRDIGWV